MVRWKISQGNRVELQKNQSWYFTNGRFGFENSASFAILNDGVGMKDRCF
jgi:hypothetical protein